MNNAVIIFGIACIVLLVVVLYKMTQYHFNDDMAARSSLLNLIPAVVVFIICGIIIFGSKLIDRKTERKNELLNLRDSIEYKDSIINLLQMEIRKIDE